VISVQRVSYTTDDEPIAVEGGIVCDGLI